VNWVDSRTPVVAGRRSPAGSAEQFDGDEAELAIADVLPVMDQRFVRRVLGVGRVTDVVLAGNHRPIGGALAADASVHHGPEVPAGVGVERAALTLIQLSGVRRGTGRRAAG
jgi:hypothetical protein